VSAARRFAWGRLAAYTFVMWALSGPWGLAEAPGISGLPQVLPVEEIAPGIYLHRGAQEEASPENGGAIANIGFIVGTECVAVIDTGGTLAEGRALRAAVRRVTPLPIAYVILTHMHPDHVLGAAAFEQDEPRFIGHLNLPNALARRGDFYLERARSTLGHEADGTRVVMPTETVAEDLSLDLGGRTLGLHAYPTAHTNNDLSVRDSKTGTLWLSDLLFVQRIPALDGSILGWLKVIDRLNQGRAQTVVPGHGPVPADWHKALADERRYLESVATGVRQVIGRMGTIDDAVATVARDEKPNWLLFDDYNGRNVTAAFVELEWE
jgi:quinoprotein relay system zinc metallohydrolase 2